MTKCISYCNDGMFAQAYAAWADGKVASNHGYTDQKEADGLFYLILYINYFVNSYTLDAMEYLKKRKDIYRHRNKQHINGVLEWINSYEKRIFKTMGEEATREFTNICLVQQDRFQHMLDRLEEVTVKALSERGEDDATAKAKLEVCIMLNEFTTDNVYNTIKMSMNKNPIMKHVGFTSQKDNHHRLTEISKTMVSADISRDIHVVTMFSKIQRHWYDADFLTGAITQGIEETRDNRDFLD